MGYDFDNSIILKEKVEGRGGNGRIRRGGGRAAAAKWKTNHSMKIISGNSTDMN
jgi:hypothetical protein